MTTKAFADILSRLAGQSEGYRKTAFENASEKLKKYPHDDITVEEAKRIPGFGKGCLDRLAEYLETHEVAELKKVDEKQSVIVLFEGIYGVGPILAHKWYELGYRTLEDIPRQNLTISQKLGLEYYHDINDRIPRAEIEHFDQILQSKISLFNTKHKCHLRAQICGSYLRGKETSGDLDIILSERNNQLPVLSDVFLSYMYPAIRHILAKGATKALCLGGIQDKQRRIDFEFVQDENWFFALLYFTGSKNFNKRIRGIAKERGMLLNHAGLFITPDENCMFQVNSEKEIFDILDIAYLSPSERN